MTHPATPLNRSAGRLRAAALAVLLLAIAPGCAATTSEPAAAPAEGRLSEETLPHDGRMRRFLVQDFSDGRPAPVVILLHGGGGTAEIQVEMARFEDIARREGLIAVYPDGTGGTPGGRLLTWNAGHCCAYAMRNDVDDVGFVAAMIDALVASGRADPDRIYITGMSNGAMMSHRLGRELSDKVAAIGPVVGAVFGDEPPPAGPVPAVIFVGAEDRIVPGDGGPLGREARGGPVRALLGAGDAADHDVAPAIAQAEYWAQANGCAGSTTDVERGTQIVRYSGCRDGADVVLYVVAGNGHAWPGGAAPRAAADEPVTEFDASEVMWDFFERHPRR